MIKKYVTKKGASKRIEKEEGANCRGRGWRALLESQDVTHRYHLNENEKLVSWERMERKKKIGREGI